MKGKRGREEVLLSYFIVTSPARRALETHPLHITFNTKSGIASFCITAFGKQDLEGMGTYRGFAAFSVFPRNVNL